MTARRNLSMRVLRVALAAASCSCWFSCAWGQELPRPYRAPDLPPERPASSSRLQSLLRAGNLYLTAQDAIALALENNVDLEMARYNSDIAFWQLEHAKAGGTRPNGRSAASQVGAVASGQGVRGSEAAAGVVAPGGTASETSNAAIADVGVVLQNLDPDIQLSTVFSHTSAPQVDTTLSQTSVLISTTRVYDVSVGLGFLTGGSATASYTEHYLNENAPTDTLNPTVAPNVSVLFQQNLLRGFGTAVNARPITVAKISRTVSDLIFKTQVINVVVQALNLHYGLVAAYEDVKATQSAVELAQTLYDDNERLVRIGALAPLDLTAAASQLALAQRDLITSQSALQRQELQLKNLLSRTGVADPLLRNAAIIPVDRIVIPEADNLPPMEVMIQQALDNRSDLAIDKWKEDAANVNALGTRNGLLPALRVFAGEGEAGLAGVAKNGVVNGAPVTADTYFTGGIGTALGQVFRRDAPTDRVGAVLEAPIGNRQAQADYGIDRLGFRQLQLTNRKDINQVQVDLMKSVVALQQARGRYEVAVKNQALAKELLDTEQKKLRLGNSTPYFVARAQRDLVTAESAGIAAQIGWVSARIALDQSLGTTLETNHISLASAQAGKAGP